MAVITAVHARQILIPAATRPLRLRFCSKTVLARAAVPSGASTGEWEAD